MIFLETKSNLDSSSPLSLSTSNEIPKLSFSELLRGVNKKDSEVVQNGTLLLSLENTKINTKTTLKTTTKNAALLSLLKNENNNKNDSKDILELNPKLTHSLTPKELKTLVSNAKQYLKSKILESDGYKKVQIQELPKTLKGLATLAKKMSIDISKISIEEVQSSKEQNIKPDNIKIKDLKFTPIMREQKAISPKEAKTTLPKNVEAISPKELKTASLTKEEKIISPEALKTNLSKNIEVASPKEIQTTPLTKEEKVISPKDIQTEPLKQLKSTQVTKEENTLSSKEIKTVPIMEDKSNNKTTKSSKVVKKTTIQKAQISTQNQHELENKQTEAHKQTEFTKPTALYKAQNSKEFTTEQLVIAKQFKVEAKTPKEKADYTLKLLLRGEKPSLTDNSLKTEFSVGTTKAISAMTTTEASKSLEQLLHGESSREQHNGSTTKAETIMTHKSDSFEIKLNEAKQMIKYISQDVKTAIQDYKSPFTRIKVQLNPQKLGAVDLTIVQRGKNLHVNISSNNTAINTLSMNANELKVQLNNSGINNATLNFNNTSQDSDSTASQQQHNRQNESRADREYKYLENEEANEEILSSLEIIVPQYG